jgi:hypothetical protein
MGCISYIADVVGLVVPSCLLDRKVKADQTSTSRAEVSTTHILDQERQRASFGARCQA